MQEELTTRELCQMEEFSTLYHYLMMNKAVLNSGAYVEPVSFGHHPTFFSSFFICLFPRHFGIIV